MLNFGSVPASNHKVTSCYFFSVNVDVPTQDRIACLNTFCCLTEEVGFFVLKMQNIWLVHYHNLLTKINANKFDCMFKTSSLRMMLIY